MTVAVAGNGAGMGDDSAPSALVPQVAHPGVVVAAGANEDGIAVEAAGATDGACAAEVGG